MTAPSSTPIDLELLRSWIGRQETARDVVSIELVRKFRATFDFPASWPHPGDRAPHLLHFCLAQPTVCTNLLAEDGHPRKGGFLPPVPLPRRMWAGSSLAFEGTLCVGDHVRRSSRIANVVTKEGRAGPLCFVTIEHSIDVDGQVVLNETQDLVYRGSGGAPAQERAASTAEVGTCQRQIEPSAPLLFRYSALTFNSHRIHYDRRYACEVEGYPGLVVHGPLQATLLIDFATQLHGAPPARFAFRSVSPLFDNATFLLHAQEGDGTLKLWTARENGPVAMSAEAQWA
jgi:3-methylfumaryl-CoA hydratase